MKTWSEKNTFEKVLDVISGIAVFVWVILGFLERTHGYAWADAGTYVAAIVVCICQAFTYWNEKRALSYVAIAGVVCMIAVVILLAL